MKVLVFLNEHTEIRPLNNPELKPSYCYLKYS